MLTSRVVLLIGCTALGGLIGAAGEYLSGHAAWYLAIPLCIAVGWFAVADPTACAPRPEDRDRSSPADR